MGPIDGGTTVLINMECNTDNQTAVVAQFHDVKAYFASESVNIMSVVETGYIAVHSTGAQAEAEVSWKYVVNVT
jgi:hypothetical protein